MRAALKSDAVDQVAVLWEIAVIVSARITMRPAGLAHRWFLGEQRGIALETW